MVGEEVRVRQLAQKITVECAGVIAGDFSVWTTECGSKVSNNRRLILLESFPSLDIVVSNFGNTDIIRKESIGSVVNITFVSTALMRYIT